MLEGQMQSLKIFEQEYYKMSYEVQNKDIELNNLRYD